MKYENELLFAKQLAEEAGMIMRRYFRAEDIGTKWKEDNTPLTVADTTINSLVINKVKEAYPNYGVIGEEESYESEREFVWVLDPIDGTIPFSLGIPASTFCLALVHNGEVLVSVVNEPFQNRLFSAALGHGSFLNNKKLSITPVEEFQNGYFFGSEWITKGQIDLQQANLELKKRGAKNVGLPSFSYLAALVATSDFFAAYMDWGSPWDAAAVSLIVEEAGGKATDLYGKPRKYNEWGEGILITNGYIHEEIVKIMKKHANNRH